MTFREALSILKTKNDITLQPLDDWSNQHVRTPYI